MTSVVVLDTDEPVLDSPLSVIDARVTIAGPRTRHPRVDELVGPHDRGRVADTVTRALGVSLA